MDGTPPRFPWVPRLITPVGAALAVIFYGMRPFESGPLGTAGVPDQGCGYFPVSQRCSGTITTIFAGDFCGPYARHRLVVLVGLIGLWIFFGDVVRRRVRDGHFRSLIHLKSLRLALPCALIGTAAGAWSYGIPDPCNSFVTRIEATAGGLGIALVAWLLGERLIKRRARVTLAV